MMMKKMAYVRVLLLFIVMAGIISCSNTKNVEADEVTPVMRITIQDANGGVHQNNILYRETQYGAYITCNYYMEENISTVFIEADEVNATVNVEVLEPSLVLADTIVYNPSLTLTTVGNPTIPITFTSHRGTTQTLNCKFYAIKVDLAIDNILTSVGTKGFHPSKNNYLRIRSNFSTNMLGGYDSSMTTTLRILNNKNKWVYQKRFDCVDGKGYIDLKWNGKASKNNEAGVKATYVKNGTYKVQVIMSYNNGSYQKTVKKTKSFKVSRKAPAGTKGIAKAKGIITYTGRANLDYMAEQMIKSAGVKSNMSAEQKVKKIYSYMTKKFKHKHYGDKRKTYYNLTKLESEIAKFKEQTDKKQKQGKLVYNNIDPFYVESNMSTRSGSCTEHAIIFKILCNHVGVEASIHEGYYLNRNGSKSYHFWNSAIVNGKTYYYDVDVEIQNYGKGQGNYYWYKKTLKQAKKNHKFGK